ncbi:TetR/AcrR family transcriptional regulator [Streptomyces sp. N2-109]|uniref:TetR/AcrR family transcriptional regulator n=1 Tax=Streptomyces gossypii TaxID=2883101 RepID=A0ABT2JXI0_9ACTN|nr:TetR/AcrR family transcriptional regulator [Streptomyces gossypii]MCT2592612.1 TetR/AcrR family transcriptional regulator [Streptomyces gossypii]
MRADAQHNREQILRAARQIFVHEGPDAPLDEIARRAGVGVATLYRRFPSREDLVHAVAVSTLQELYQAISHSVELEADPFEALRRAMHAALDLKIGAVMPSLFGRIEMNKLLGEAPDAVDPLQQLIIKAQEAALLRADVVPGDVIFMIIRLTRPLPGGRFPEDEALAHRQLEIYLDGLRPSAAWPRRQRLPGPAIGVIWFRRIRERMAGGSPATPPVTPPANPPAAARSD